MDDFDKDNRDKDGINLAGFLFGNIDERGELEDSDVLDDVRICCFSFLCRDSKSCRIACEIHLSFGGFHGLSVKYNHITSNLRP